MSANKKNYPVIIIGGGPCGLLTSLLLGRMGVENLLVEKHPSTSRHPKAMGLTRRTMEILAQLGLDRDIREADCVTAEHALSLWCESLCQGEIYARAEINQKQSPYSDYSPVHCPQTHLEAVLHRAVAAQPGCQLMFGWQMQHFNDNGERVQVLIRERSGATEKNVEAEYMVAADGAASGVRGALGIETDGPGDMGHFLNIFFRADFGKLPAERQSILYQALSPEYMEFFVAVNGRDLWLMHHFLQPGEVPADYPPERLKAMIGKASGREAVEVEILGVNPWVMSPKIARTFRLGRVFLTGDASARLSPAGGLGMNTGLQSVQNLAWKLAARINHGAGDSLLDSYTQERHAAAKFTMDNSGGNAREIFSIIEQAFSGQWETAKTMMRNSRRKGAGLGQDLGLAYSTGAFIADGSNPPAVDDPINDYTPFAGPGHRAPHLPVSEGGWTRSIITLFGQSFVLLTGEDGEAWNQAAANQPIPLPIYKIGGSECDFQADGFCELYGITPNGAVLIRPDGYVGYRCATLPKDPQAALTKALQGIL